MTKEQFLETVRDMSTLSPWDHRMHSTPTRRFAELCAAHDPELSRLCHAAADAIDAAYAHVKGRCEK